MPQTEYTIEAFGKTITYPQPYITCVIDGVSVPDYSYWWGHPHFLDQIGGRTVNDVKVWLNEHFVPLWLEENEDADLEDGEYTSTGYLMEQLSGPYYWSDSNQRIMIRKGYRGADPAYLVRTRTPRSSERADSGFVLLSPEDMGIRPTEENTKPIWRIRTFDFNYSATVEGSDREFSHGIPVVVLEPGGPSNASVRDLIRELPEHCRKLMNYSFRPRFEFLKHHRDPERCHLFFGMELEVSTRLSVSELMMVATQMEPKQHHFFYCKSDSSVNGRYENKFEIVTMPCTPRRLKSEFRTLFKKLEHLCHAKGESLGDYFDLSGDLTNGLHIHVSNDAFVQYGTRLNTHKNKFLSIWNGWDREFQSFLQKLSKRPTPLEDNRYCYPHPAFTGRTLAWRIGKGSNGQSDRHSAAHDGGSTCEVRVFQGLVNLNHILSCIELTQAMFEYTADAPISAFKTSAHLKFIEWVGKQNGYRHAKEALGQCV